MLLVHKHDHQMIQTQTSMHFNVWRGSLSNGKANNFSDFYLHCDCSMCPHLASTQAIWGALHQGIFNQLGNFWWGLLTASNSSTKTVCMGTLTEQFSTILKLISYHGYWHLFLNAVKLDIYFQHFHRQYLKKKNNVATWGSVVVHAQN